MVNAYSLMPVLVLELRKVAASRLDKEVAAGNVSYSDVDPRIPRPMGDSGMAKRISRAEGMAPTARSPERVERLRSLRGALFNNQHMQAAHDEEQPWLTQTPQTPRRQLGTKQMSRSDVILHSATEHNSPHTIIGDTIGPRYVTAPNTSGRTLRTVLEPFGKSRVATSVHHRSKIYKSLAKPHPMDRTLNHAILEHELGEADLAGSAGVTPFSGHFGVQPIARENMGLIGDAEAQQVMSRIRQLNTDDMLVQRKLRQVGNHPDWPIPVEGRASRAIERSLQENPGQLSPASRLRSVNLALADSVEYITRVKGLSEKYNVPVSDISIPESFKVKTLPEKVTNYVDKHAPAMAAHAENTLTAHPLKNLISRLRLTAKLIPDYYRNVHPFVR